MADLLARLAEAFPRVVLSGQTVALYAEALSDLDRGELAATVDEIIGTRRDDRFPTIGEIRATNAERTLGLPDEVAALTMIERRLAWARLPDGERGAGPTVHPLVAEALALVGGYHGLKSSERPEVTRGQFLRYYREMRAKAVRGAQHALSAAPTRARLGA